MLGKTQILKLLIKKGGITMKILQKFSYFALSLLVFLSINSCSDNQMTPTEPVQVEDQITLKKKSFPSGPKMAFTSFRDGNAEVYIMNADGSNQTRLTDNPARDGLLDWGFFGVDDDDDEWLALLTSYFKIEVNHNGVCES